MFMMLGFNVVPLVTSAAEVDVRGNYNLDLTCVTGYDGCAGTVFPHMMNITTEDIDTGVLSGNGNSISDPTMTWDLTGNIVGSTVTFHILYTGTGAGYTFDLTGTRSIGGGMSGTGSDSIGDTFTWTATMITSPEGPQTATISATKIVCPTENLLPNWGSGGADITATTASAFIEANPTCSIVPWNFEWAPGDTANPGDNAEVAGGSWTSFTSTASVPAGGKVWLREQMKPGYIPFSSATSDLNSATSKNSAEFYCNSDVLNYDNYEWIDPVTAGGTYHCVAFNVLTEAPKQCDVVSDSTNIVEETGDNAVPTFVHAAWAHPSWIDTLPFAKWIWSAYHVANPTTEETKTFVKTFNLDVIPSSATIDVAADNGFILEVNGMVIADKFAIETNYGSTVSYPVTNLVAGVNTIRMKVKNFGLAGSTSESNPAGALYRLHIDGGNCSDVVKNLGKIHVIKFIDGERATAIGANNAMFSMFINHPDGDFMLRANGWVAGDGAYEATTFAHPKGSKFTIKENLGTSLVGASCNDGKSYALEGYSTASTYEAAITAPMTITAPEITIDGDQYLIVHNTKCFGEQNPPFVRMHIYKYLAGPDGTAQVPNSSTITPFPMHSVQQEPTKAVVNGYYTLGIYNGGAPEKYGSLTANMLPHTNYSTEEMVDLPTGKVLSTGSQCSAGKYRLVGYKTGIGSLAAAESAPITTSASLTDITNDAYIIVINEDCDNLPPPVLDVCPNISGVQTEVPSGYHLSENQCVQNVTINNGGGGSGGNNGGGRVLGASTVAPQGKVLGASTSCGIYLDKFLRKGYKNDTENVKKIQKFLNDYIKAGLTVDGMYGDTTEKAVKRFQSMENGDVLAPWGFKKPTGITYLTTTTRINNIMCPDLKLPIPKLVPIETNPDAPKK